METETIVWKRGTIVKINLSATVTWKGEADDRCRRNGFTRKPISAHVEPLVIVNTSATLVLSKNLGIRYYLPTRFNFVVTYHSVRLQHCHHEFMKMLFARSPVNGAFRESGSSTFVDWKRRICVHRVTHCFDGFQAYLPGKMPESECGCV